MHIASLFRGLPASLLLLVAAQVASEALPPSHAGHLPIAVRKMGLDSGEKLLPEFMVFAVPVQDDVDIFASAPLTPREAALAARLGRRDDDLLLPAENTNTSIPPRPPFSTHHGLDDGDSAWELFRRAAEALHLLGGRQSCPSGMNSCAAIGQPNKCCVVGEVCVEVDDSSVGQVACCPQGRTCTGAVGSCAAGSTSCPAELGGGCCIPGFVCQGLGCAPSASATPTPTTTPASVQTITTTATSVVGGANPSLTVVTIVVTITPTPPVTTSTTTQVVTATSPSNTDAVPPYRPTSSPTPSTSTSTAPATTPPGPSTCPTGYYPCLARYDGGCCQTGRDCATTSCPSTPSTTIVGTDGVTVVVPVTAVPGSLPTSTCASGWYLCGADAGPVPGCCPSGYSCGSASCTLVSPTQTAEVQKALPGGGFRRDPPAWAACVAVVVGMFVTFCSI